MPSLVFDIGSLIVAEPGLLPKGSLWLDAIGVVGALAAALVGTGPLVLSAAALVVLAASGYLGGKPAYRYGVRVAAETTQAEGYRTH
ncbi:hypothetical protein [Amycolatopsis sp. CA-128772]|uniref:hypothetical protein n=1 Tax=Amycolatopsis sp. CA-128772 TaxID=2073159 RepID=UPI001E5CDEEE|nr:hypothetical protein [Amycolatopsis sp. CA-128772]